MWIIIVLFLAAVLLVSSYLSSFNTSRDILLKTTSYRNESAFNLGTLDLPDLNGRSEDEVYEVVGKEVTRRLTFKTPRTKTIAQKTFQYEKIIVYKDYRYEHTTRVEGSNRINTSTPLEHSELVVYLLDEKVVYFAALHEVRDNGDMEYQPTKKSRNLGPDNEPWPNSEQDILEYNQEKK